MTLDSIYFFLKAIWTDWPRQSLGLAALAGVSSCDRSPLQFPISRTPPSASPDCVQVLTYSYCCLRTAIFYPIGGSAPISPSDLVRWGSGDMGFLGDGEIWGYGIGGDGEGQRRRAGDELAYGIEIYNLNEVQLKAGFYQMTLSL